MGFYCSDHCVSLLKVAALMFRENTIKFFVFFMVKLSWILLGCFVVVICIKGVILIIQIAVGKLKESDE